jgi:E3 ubiquitin-protein ligase RBX1
MEGRPEVKVKKVMLVAVWSLDMIVDKCAICRNHIMDSCIECQTEESDLPVECKVAWGSCNHAFHSHCIVQWLKSKNICPLDAKPWVYQKGHEDQ